MPCPWERPVRFSHSLMNKKCLGFLWLLTLSAFAQKPDPPFPKTTKKEDDHIKVSVFGEVNHPQVLDLPSKTPSKRQVERRQVELQTGSTYSKVTG